MDRIDIIKYPEKHGIQNVYVEINFEENLKDIIECSGNKQKFAALYKQRLKYLDENLEKCILYNEWFEKLVDADPFYSMRFNKFSGNPRILFCFTKHFGKKIAILCHCFCEKKGSKDYARNIKIAKNIL